MLLVVSYHYIGPNRFEFPGIHPVAPADFRAQVEELARTFEFVSESDLIAALDGQRSLPRRGCLLTFDDGLREQYLEAAPILESFRVPAIFFVPGLPYEKGEALTVHRIHRLRCLTPPDAFLARLTSACRELGLEDRLTAAEQHLSGKYFWDDRETRTAKFLLNTLLNDDEQTALVSLLEGSLQNRNDPYYQSLYMKPDEVRDLAHRFAVGTHSYAHVALARRPRPDIEREIRRGIAALADLGVTPSSISYPYGYQESVSEEVFTVARECGLRLGFTTERSFNLTLEAPLALARVDTNDVPGGKSPIVIPNAGGFELRGAMKAGRCSHRRESISEQDAKELTRA